MNTPDKTGDLIRMVVSRLSGSVGRLRLIKMLYLIDVEARKHLGHPITDLQYYVDEFGPFDKAIYGHVDRLRGEIREETYDFDGGRGFVYYYAGNLPGVALTPGEDRIATWVLDSFGRLPRRELLDEHVYSSKPWRLANRDVPHTPLPMTSVDNEASPLFFGFSLEKVLESDRAFANNDAITLTEFIEEHGRLHPKTG